MPDLATPTEDDRASAGHALERFEAVWRSGRLPRLTEFVPEGADRGPTLIELVRIDLEYRWRQPELARRWTDALGERPKLEMYVAHLPELGPLDRLPAELVVEEFWVRHRWGD